MAVSWPFDSTLTQDGDGNPVYSRTYSSDVLAAILARYFRNGVFASPSDGLQVLQNEGMTVLVKAGAANLNGRQFLEESDRVLAVQAAHASLDRIDTVVLRLNLDQSVLAVDLYMLTGTAAVTPAAPALTRNASVWELGLANPFIVKNATGITQQRITDTRLDDTRCGIVASIVGDTDTTAYYAQIAAELAAFKAGREADFDAWFALIQNTLGADAAGNLLNLIQALQENDVTLTTMINTRAKKTSFQTGTATITVPANSTASVAVTYPAGAFTTAPTVNVTAVTSLPALRNASILSVTETGFTIYACNNSVNSGNIVVHWMALLMEP